MLNIVNSTKKRTQSTEWKKYQKYKKIYAQRFNRELTPEEIRFCIEGQFMEYLGETPDLENPKTYQEKMAWLKLYYHNPLMGICADKVAARDYYLDRIENGNQHLVKQLGVYKSPNEINLQDLPPTFIFKSNWGSGLQKIIAKKDEIDEVALKRELQTWLQKEKNHYFASFETGYKNITPYIIAEELISFTYKLEIFCFNGQPKFFWIVVNDKTQQVQANFYNLDWQLLPIDNKYPNICGAIEKTEFYPQLLDQAKKLCQPFPFVRCDFYVAPKHFYFSEMTFFHWGGLKHFRPQKYDLIFGDMLQLPQKDE